VGGFYGHEYSPVFQELYAIYSIAPG